jgi:hypothetical protein
MKARCCGERLHSLQESRFWFTKICLVCKKTYTQYKRQSKSTWCDSAWIANKMAPDMARFTKD